MFLEDFDDEQYHQMLKKEGFKEGFDSGSDNINTLVQKLLADNRTDDLRRFFQSRRCIIQINQSAPSFRGFFHTGIIPYFLLSFYRKIKTCYVEF